MCYAHKNIKDNFKKIKHSYYKKRAKNELLCLKLYFLKVASKSRVVKTNPKSTHLVKNKA